MDEFIIILSDAMEFDHLHGARGSHEQGTAFEDIFLF